MEYKIKVCHRSRTVSKAPPSLTLSLFVVNAWVVPVCNEFPVPLRRIWMSHKFGHESTALRAYTKNSRTSETMKVDHARISSSVSSTATSLITFPLLRLQVLAIRRLRVLLPRFQSRVLGHFSPALLPCTAAARDGAHSSKLSKCEFRNSVQGQERQEQPGSATTASLRVGPPPFPPQSTRGVLR